MSQNVHILPLDDICPHIESRHCLCKPRVEEESGGLLIIHNAYDGRDRVERYMEETQGEDE